MKIERIEISRHSLTLEPPFAAAWDSRPRRDFIADIVQVYADDGSVGIGSGDSMAGIDDYLDHFIGGDPRDMDRHFKVLDNIAFHVGRPWPLDIALWDLYGKAEGQPVYKLLGGTAGRLRTYASLGVLRSEADMAAQARRLAAAGFPALKIRFQRPDVAEDLAVLAAVRGAVGPDIELMVDCNQGWRMPWDIQPPWTYDRALTVARALEDLGVYWMEEPLHRGDYAGMASLRAATDLMIAGGEMTRELHELRTLVERRCLDVLQPDCVLTGGITGLHRVGLFAKHNGVVFTPHTWGNGIGLMANLHLAAGLGGAPYLEFPYDPPDWTPERRDFPLALPLFPDAHGFVTVPDAPGLGIELNEELLERTRIG